MVTTRVRQTTLVSFCKKCKTCQRVRLGILGEFANYLLDSAFNLKALKQPNLVIWVELRYIARGCCIVAPPVEHVMRLGTYGLSSQKETKVTKLACRIGQ